MLSKEEMAVRLAKIEWQLEGSIAGFDKMTKAEINNEMTTVLHQIRALYKAHTEKRPRGPNKPETVNHDEAQADVPPDEQEELPLNCE